MNELNGTQLPSFDRFRAGEVEPAIRELLQRSRGEVAHLEAQPHPTFDNTVLPLEQLSHRLSRTWSPVSHLNGVLNSDELRASYNACLPLLTNYWTDLAQSERIFAVFQSLGEAMAVVVGEPLRPVATGWPEFVRLRDLAHAHIARHAGEPTTGPG